MIKFGWDEWNESVDEVYINDNVDDDNYKRKYPFL